ncbi:NAD(P)H-dependent oxidoreductase [Chryseobacterium sp. 1B4]
MKRVLHITSSPRSESSISKKLGNAVVEKITAKYPDHILKKRDLANPLFLIWKKRISMHSLHQLKTGLLNSRKL